jgi:ferredoxin-NADP reductase
MRRACALQSQAAATGLEVQSGEPPVWNLGVYGGGGETAERGIMKMYEYSPEEVQMPDVTVTCVEKKLLVEPIPADWVPEDGDTAQRQPVWQITFANPEGPDYNGNTDFETIGCAIDRGDAIKFRFGEKAKAFSVCREEPGYFDICAKVYPHGYASGYLNRMQVGDKIDCYVHRKGKRVSRERRAGSHVALVAYGVGITEILPLAACELAQVRPCSPDCTAAPCTSAPPAVCAPTDQASHVATPCLCCDCRFRQPEPEQVRILWASRTRGDCAFWRDQLEALKLMHPDRFSFVEIFSRDAEHAEATGSLQGRIDADVCKLVFDQYWGTYVGGPNEAARPGVRFQNVAEKELLKAADKMWEKQLGYPKKTQRLCLDAEDAKK